MAIEEAYLDAGFYSAGVLWSLNETGSHYVMSAPKDPALKRWEQRNLQMHDVAVKRDYGVSGSYGSIEGGAGRRVREDEYRGNPAQGESREDGGVCDE